MKQNGKQQDVQQIASIPVRRLAERKPIDDADHSFKKTTFRNSTIQGVTKLGLVTATDEDRKFDMKYKS